MFKVYRNGTLIAVTPEPVNCVMVNSNVRNTDANADMVWEELNTTRGYVDKHGDKWTYCSTRRNAARYIAPGFK